MDQQEAEDLAKRLKVNFFRTSVKKNFNVSAVFDSLAQQYLSKHGSSLDLDGDIDLEDEIIPTMSITDIDKPIQLSESTNVSNFVPRLGSKNTFEVNTENKLSIEQGLGRENDLKSLIAIENEVSNDTIIIQSVELFNDSDKSNDQNVNATENTKRNTKKNNKKSNNNPSHFQLSEHQDNTKIQSRKKKFLLCQIL